MPGVFIPAKFDTLQRTSRVLPVLWVLGRAVTLSADDRISSSNPVLSTTGALLPHPHLDCDGRFLRRSSDRDNDKSRKIPATPDADMVTGVFVPGCGTPARCSERTILLGPQT
jgi:hypothetical protein